MVITFSRHRRTIEFLPSISFLFIEDCRELSLSFLIWTISISNK